MPIKNTLCQTECVCVILRPCDLWASSPYPSLCYCNYPSVTYRSGRVSHFRGVGPTGIGHGTNIVRAQLTTTRSDMIPYIDTSLKRKGYIYLTVDKKFSSDLWLIVALALALALALWLWLWLCPISNNVYGRVLAVKHAHRFRCPAI